MYEANTVNVADSDWTEVSPDIDIQAISVYSESGAFDLQIKQNNVYGDSIRIYKGVSFSDDISANKIQLKSVSGTIAISYYLSDKK